MKSVARLVMAYALLMACAPAMAQTIHGQPDAPVAGAVLGIDIHTRDADELRYYVLKELTERYAEERAITVTTAEIDAYVQHVQAALRKDRLEREAQRDALSRKLADGGMSDAARESMAAELSMLNEFIETLSGIGEGLPESPEDEAARRQIAAAFIRQWKINQALFREYGGRIVFQQGGPEPLDAYRSFLEANQLRGDFAITNKDLEMAFWGYYQTDSIHSFYPPGSQEEAQAFTAPPWLAP